MAEIVSALPAENWKQPILPPAKKPKPAIEIDLKDMEEDNVFLLHFVMGTYFGPDLKNEKDRLKSALQRKAENLPCYSSNDLTGSLVKRVELENVYLHILRKADPSLRASSRLFREFFRGQRKDVNKDIPLFKDLFPLSLHPQSRMGNRYVIIKNITFINDPDTSYMTRDEIERFKRLTGLECFLVDINVEFVTRPVTPLALPDTDNNVAEDKVEVNEEPEDRNGCLAVSVIGASGNNVENCGDVNRGLIFLPSYTSNQERANATSSVKSGFDVTGTAATGQVGLMDIGECDDAYLFRVSLPGVKRDESYFSCEVEDNGKVMIRGVTTTGETRVYRFSQVFEMQTRNLCPPGPFSISFRLPGPVDPEQFSGSFGTDGILEGMVMKKLQKQTV
ncbi:PREDICTED: increased DNA methylation 2 isoform X2 [Tarenaya hassleriana]|nr:PREDICTED: increased DNA methylation 2 isoform X2 [Tarenaya hassleriana]